MTEAWSLVALILSALAGALVVGTLTYTVITFIAMRGHVARRPLRITLRELLREVLVALPVQPLLPLYYFIGSRFGGARDGTPIVLVHGYSQNRVDFIALARALRRANLGPIYGFNYPWWLPVEDNGRRLSRFAARVMAETGACVVDVVGHSMGGLVAIEAMRSHGLPVRRCVTIASPHAGVTWRGPLLGASGRDLRAGSVLLCSHADYRPTTEILSLCSTHDNVVHPESTTALTGRGGRDAVVGQMGHLAILFAAPTLKAVVEFLGRVDGSPGTAVAARTSHAHERVEQE